MKRTMTLRFGPATVELRAEKPYSDILESLGRWLGSQPSEKDAQADLCVALSRGRAPGRRRGEKAWSAAAAAGWWDGKAWDAVPLFDKVTGTVQWKLFLHESMVMRATRIVPDAVIRWAHVHRFGRAEMLASAALFGHLLPAAQEALRHHQATLVHASAVTSRDGDAVLFVGRGGAGKTSASTQLYIRKPKIWRYMSDDLAVLTADGTLYCSPVPLNIFPYNTESFPELWNLLAREMSLSDRLQWKVRRTMFGAAGTARRRAPFSDYLGPPIARIRQVIELDRADISSPMTEASEADQVAREARDVLAHELRRGCDGIYRMRAVAEPESVPLPDPSAALDDAERVMRSAFRTARLHRVTLPILAPPYAVGEVVEGTIRMED